MNTFTYNPAYQASIAATVATALQIHNRVTAIRVDLRLPDNFGGIDMSNSIITRFFESLKAKIAVGLKHKNKAWGRNHTCILKYVWVREVGHRNGKMHFHILALLNKDVYYSLGDFNDESGNLACMIRQAWSSALGLPFLGYQQLVHFPDRGVMFMDKNSPEFMPQLQIVLDRANYLAKEFTKQYGDGQRSFGCSR
ncbi:inovirus Gp2 family protein [Herminiimonas aquatilis]|uniref:Inovirus Gp2 family protein n=1 Tax=Herminiimonas aquatilis TaxID=345342 RepID=A0ABW2J6W4_9BURK